MRDLESFESRGWDLSEVDQQWKKLKTEAEPLAVIGPCTDGQGLFVLNAASELQARKDFDTLRSSAFEVARFVPASGAASRMFAGVQGELSEDVRQVLSERWNDFPFVDVALRSQLNEIPASQRADFIAHWMMHATTGLAPLPKGLVPFHRDSEDNSHTPFQEHVKEWEALGTLGTLHFTVPRSFQDHVQKHVSSGLFPLETSLQRSVTDTLAMDQETGQPVRDLAENLIFRPGGHGALLQNLNALKAPFVFVRNIDNVVSSSRMADRNASQEVLGGMTYRLFMTRNEIMRALRQGAPDAMDRAQSFLADFVHESNRNVRRDRAAYMDALNRPIRVAGMVRNTGQPGGGPFWVRREDGTIVPSIVESVELAVGIMEQGTHFNPVDMCCCTEDAEGEPFDLNRFADANRYLTANKYRDGKAIRILERPGLWNGSMDYWLTRFVEVPASTFAPVKTVFDLLERSDWT